MEKNIRHWMHDRFRAKLAGGTASWMEFSGDYAERCDTAVAAITLLLDAG